MNCLRKIPIVKILIIMSVAISVTSCSIHGHYTSNPKSHVAFAGHDIILNKDQNFEIRRWSDNYTTYTDASGNIIWKDPQYQGQGTFRQLGDSLELTFLSEDSIAVEIIKSSDCSNDKYKIAIINEVGIKDAPIVSLKNANNKTIKSAFPQDQEYTIFQDFTESGIVMIGFDLHMFRTEPILIPLKALKEGKNILKFKSYKGYYPKGTVINFYCKRAWSGIRYGDKKRWLAKKYKMKWLNKLY